MSSIKDLKIINIYTDGSCKINPGGPGAWAVVIPIGNEIKKLSAYVQETTNNRMELMAVIHALKYVRDNLVDLINVNHSNQHACSISYCSIDALCNIYSDSQYVVNGMNKWIHGWKKKGWHNVKNIDLWQELDAIYLSLSTQKQIIERVYINGEAQEAINNYPMQIDLKVNLEWVRGHNGDKFNEMADQLANQTIVNMQLMRQKT